MSASPQTIDIEQLAAAIAGRIAGRPVAIVGNAQSLLAGSFGPEIDRKCVVRMNAGIPSNAAAQGQRVDIHCFSTWPSLQDNLAQVARNAGDRAYFDEALRVWMSMADRDNPTDERIHFYPEPWWSDLAERLDARPSVGAMVVDLFSRLNVADVTLYGFDFKATGTYYRKTQNPGPHDWQRERQFVQAVAETNGWAIRMPQSDAPQPSDHSTLPAVRTMVARLGQLWNRK